VYRQARRADGVDLQAVGPTALGPTAADARARLETMATASGRRPGERLGGERDLAASLGISRATLRQALDALERDGVVSRVRGRGGGTFVAPRKVERDLSSGIVGVPELLRDQGFTAGTQVVEASVTGANEDVAAGLGLVPGALVVEVVRLRLADAEPISLERARFPAARFPDLLGQPLGGSLYELFADRYDVRPADALEHIEVVGAGPSEAAVLRVAPGAPLLALTRTTRDANGVAFEFSADLFRADRTRLVVRSPAERLIHPTSS
jgi:GntR family transcriptional regulator